MTAHRTSRDMAHQLVGYIPCDRRVRDIILAEFEYSPCVGDIAHIRRARRYGERAALRRAETWGSDTPDPYHNGEYAQRVKDMELANSPFLRALRRERAA